MVIDGGDNCQIVFQYLVVGVVVDVVVYCVIYCEGGLSNQIFIIVVFVFDVVFDGVVVEVFCEGDEYLKMVEQYEVQFFVWCVVYCVMQVGF